MYLEVLRGLANLYLNAHIAFDGANDMRFVKFHHKVHLKTKEAGSPVQSRCPTNQTIADTVEN